MAAAMARSSAASATPIRISAPAASISSKARILRELASASGCRSSHSCQSSRAGKEPRVVNTSLA